MGTNEPEPIAAALMPSFSLDGVCPRRSLPDLAQIVIAGGNGRPHAMLARAL